MKSEPESFSIDDLERVQMTSWDGVRNYQARNYLRSQRKGDRILFYHSSCAEPGVVGIAEVAREAYPDDSAFDPTDKHYDPKSDPADPTWYMPDIKFVRRLPRVVTLHELQGRPELEGLLLTRKGNRLSVMPVSKEHFDFIVAVARRLQPLGHQARSAASPGSVESRRTRESTPKIDASENNPTSSASTKSPSMEQFCAPEGISSS